MHGMYGTSQTCHLTIHSHIPETVCLLLSLSLSLHPEYQSLDSQLDQLADYLTVLEGRGDRLTRDAQQLLLEVQGSRQNGTVTEQEQNGTETVESAESLEQNGTETVESAESLEQNVDTNQPSAGQS